MTEQEMLDLFSLHATDKDVGEIPQENLSAMNGLGGPVRGRVKSRWEFARHMLAARREMREETP